MIIRAQIFAEDGNSTIAVRGEYTGPSRGRRNEFGVPMEPDYDSSMTVDPVGEDEMGDEVELSAEQIETALEALWEKV